MYKYRIKVLDIIFIFQLFSFFAEIYILKELGKNGYDFEYYYKIKINHDYHNSK